jgi:multidrug efflux system membrane fusion protein
MDEKVTPPTARRSDEATPTKAPYTAVPTRAKPRPVRTLFVWLIVLGAIGGAGYGIYTLAQSQKATTQRQGRNGPGFGGPTSVGVATVKTGTIHVYVNALGTVTPLATVTVQTQINGQLQQVAFKEGQYVKKGDFLAQIDSRPYEALKAQYEGQLARDTGTLEQAKADNERYQTLLKQNSIAKQTADNQIFIVQQNEGTVRIDQALIDAQSLNISYCRIVAPIDGRIGLRLTDPGNYVQTSSSTGIAVITQMKPMSVLFPVAEDALNEIHPQVDKGQTLEAALFDRGNTKQIATGSVTTLDNQIDTTTGTVKLRATFANDDLALFPNQFVNVRLLVKTLDNSVVVPAAAVQRGAPGTYIYVVGDDNKVTVRKVAVGPTDKDMTAITDGLKVGDKVVVDGADRLRDGAAVMVAALDGKQQAVRPRAAPDAAKPTQATTSTPPAASSSEPQEPATARPQRRHKQGDAAAPAAPAANTTSQ